MRKSRVMSLSSIFGGSNGNNTNRKSSYDSSPPSPTIPSEKQRKLALDTATPQRSSAALNELAKDSPSPTSAQQQRNRSASAVSARPFSMVQTYSPAMMDLSGDIPAELQPVFSFLNSHQNKLYQEGYFLKLHDLDSKGRPSTDRTWTECFAQLVGTVLSLWDAAALDAAGEEGEVLPTFINLSDASIKMIESLPMNSSNGGNLQNVLSISTAANNRYLLHFNSLNSLTQWTAGIRLAMYEHSILLEAYTGSLIAGKGKLLNNIRVIMERSKFKSEDWARVRFGAGTPWRRCWCVISPPDEKEYLKAQKNLKKKNAYERKITIPKGDIKFYETRRINKKTRPIATITDAYSAYAIYPQSKPLIDQSTLVKVEGLITIHSKPEASSEGFVFVMPEVHPAVTGFEMMLRWLFPLFDTFNLYGRPMKLIADPLDQRGLMFAFPRDRRQGYLDTLDVSGLIHTEGSQTWSERQWRSELKKLTAHRMNSVDPDDGSPYRARRRNTISRTSLPSMNQRGGVRFDDDSPSSTPVSRKQSPSPRYDDDNLGNLRRADTSASYSPGHHRAVSDAVGYKRFQSETPSRLSYEANNDGMEAPPRPPQHGVPLAYRQPALERVNSEPESPPVDVYEELHAKTENLPVTPVALPPAFLHNPSSRPGQRLNQAPELRRAHSNMDAATLQQMKDSVQKEPIPGSLGVDYPDASRQEVPIDAHLNSSMRADQQFRKGMVDQSKQNSQAWSSNPYAQARAHPYMGEGGMPYTDYPHAPPVPQHAYLTPDDGMSPAARPLTPLSAAALADRRVTHKASNQSIQSIKRKPIPTRNLTPSSETDAYVPSSPSSVGGISEHGIVDDEMLERALR